MASAGQIKAIHAYIHRLGVCDSDYREMLASFRVRSSKDLSWSQAHELLTILSRRAGDTLEPRTGKRFDDLGRRPGMATPAQLRKIEALWSCVSRQESVADKRAALNTFLNNRFSISHMRMLPSDAVGKVVHTLQTMQRQEVSHG